MLLPNSTSDAVDRLPDPVRIYRGAQLKYARGMSWTTDPDTAAWFAHRFIRSCLDRRMLPDLLTNAAFWPAFG